MDSKGKKAGKGALIQEELSATLGASQDQILFQAVESHPQDSRYNIGEINQPLSANMAHDALNGGAVLMAKKTNGIITFEPGIASRDGGHVYEGVSGTLRATPGDNQMTVVFENHSQDSRYKGPLEVSQPVTATYGMGGNNQPLVICMATQQGGAEILENISPTITAAAGMSGNNQPVICLQGNGIDRADTAGCNGKGWTEDVSYTLNTIDRPAIVYPKKTGTLMANSHPGSYCGQDAYNDMLVVESGGCYCIGNGQVNDAVQMEKEICKTLNCLDDPMKILIAY